MVLLGEVRENPNPEFPYIAVVSNERGEVFATLPAISRVLGEMYILEYAFRGVGDEKNNADEQRDPAEALQIRNPNIVLIARRAIRRSLLWACRARIP